MPKMLPSNMPWSISAFLRRRAARPQKEQENLPQPQTQAAKTRVETGTSRCRSPRPAPSWTTRRSALYARARFALCAFLVLCPLCVNSAVLPARALWPPSADVSPEPEPMEVDVVQSRDFRDSVVFAGIVAFSASVRLISAEMPLRPRGSANAAALALAIFLPSVVGIAVALSVPDQRAYAWVWSQLVMLVGIFGAAYTFVFEVLEDDEDGGHVRLDLTALRDMKWKMRSMAWVRVPLSLGVVFVGVASVVIMEGWEVLSLSFSAMVIVLLGIEPKVRSLSPVFNQLGTGLSRKVIAVRSLSTQKPSSLVYSLERNTTGLILKPEQSVYGNESLGFSGSRSLLDGLIGRPAVEGEALGREPVTAGYPSMHSLRSRPWPWLQTGNVTRLKHNLCKVSIWVIFEPENQEDGSHVQVKRLHLESHAPKRPLEAVLALCGSFGSGISGNCLSHYHVVQIWSQWLEVYLPYASSGLGYTSSVAEVEEYGVENDLERLHESTESLRAGEDESISWRDDANCVIDFSVGASGRPTFKGISTGFGSVERYEQLQTRFWISEGASGSSGGDWLTRVLTASCIDKIVERQEEWALLVGYPTKLVSSVVRTQKLVEVLSGFRAGGDEELDETVVCCEKGLLVPGPGYALLELVRDYSMVESRVCTDEEAAKTAFLARHAFDLVSWGDHAISRSEANTSDSPVLQGTAVPVQDRRGEVASNEEHGSSRGDSEYGSDSSLPSQDRLRFVPAGQLQKLVLECLLEAQPSSVLYTELAIRAGDFFYGMHDFNDSGLRAFPLLAPTACSLASQFCPTSSAHAIKIHKIRECELRLIAIERLAILQLGISTFFALSALLRSL